MKPLRIISAILLIGIFSGPLSAQMQTSGKRNQKLNYRDFAVPGPRIEAGFSLGAANAITDMASSNVEQQSALTDFYSRGLSPSVAVFGRYKFNKTFAVKSSLNAMMLRGDDRWSSEIQVVNRGKSFSNNIYELAMLGEIYLPRNYERLKQDFRFNWMDLYLFTGLSVFYHNPTVKGPIIDEYDYEMLNTDNLYRNVMLAIPVGMGAKWTLANRYTLGIDLNFRYTFSDYVDGFRRPYSDRNDFFFTGNLSFGYVFNTHSYDAYRTMNRAVFTNSGAKRYKNVR